MINIDEVFLCKFNVIDKWFKNIYKNGTNLDYPKWFGEKKNIPKFGDLNVFISRLTTTIKCGITMVRLNMYRNETEFRVQN